MATLWELLIGSDCVQRTGQIGAIANLLNLPADTFQTEAVDGRPQTLAPYRPVVGRAIRARHLSPPLGNLVTSLFVHAWTAFRACHVRRSGHSASNQSMTSCRFHRTLPPSLIGFGSLPAEFNRHTCLSETPSISANSRAEMARAVFRSRHLCCCFGWPFWSVISMPFHIGSVVLPFQASTGQEICTIGAPPKGDAMIQPASEQLGGEDVFYAVMHFHRQKCII